MILVSNLREGNENCTQLEFTLFATVPVSSENLSGTLKKKSPSETVRGFFQHYTPFQH